MTPPGPLSPPLYGEAARGAGLGGQSRGGSHAGTLRRPTPGCGCRVGLRSICWAPAAAALACSRGTQRAPPPRSLNPASSGSRRPSPTTTKFPTRESESGGQEGSSPPPPQRPSLAYVSKPTYRGAGSRGGGPRHCATPALRARFSSTTRATPESLSPDQRDSAEVPVTPEKGGAPPPRSRRGSSALCSRGPRASSVARTPASRGSWAPVPVFGSCPARRTHTRCRRNGIAK